MHPTSERQPESPAVESFRRVLKAVESFRTCAERALLCLENRAPLAARDNAFSMRRHLGDVDLDLAVLLASAGPSGSLAALVHFQGEVESWSLVLEDFAHDKVDRAQSADRLVFGDAQVAASRWARLVSSAVRREREDSEVGHG